jgi:hypothetical protein
LWRESYVDIAGEKIESPIDAREGCLYFTERYVYKVLYFYDRSPNSKKRSKAIDNCDILFRTYKKANVANVPVPREVVKLEGDVYLVEGESYKKIIGIKMSRILHGKFFQLSKPDGDTIFRSRLYEIKKEFLSGVIVSLKNAIKFKIADHQGFISLVDPPLVFIDIHDKGSSFEILESLIQTAKERL